jgi:VanZ family protein
MVNWLINQYRLIARALAWVGIMVIIFLSVVPAVDRPVTGAGQWWEHFTAFALVAGVFTIGYRLSLIRLLLCAVFFCGGVELLQVPLPTRHARVSDFVVNIIGSCFGIGFVLASEKLFRAQPHCDNLVLRPRKPSSS